MFRATVLSTVLLLAAAPVAASAADHDPALVTLLSMFHEEPSPEQLASFQPDLGDKLRAIAEDASVRRLARVRALSALGYVGDDDAFAVVSRFAVAEDVHVRLRLAAVWTVGRRFASHPAAVEVLRSALADADAGVREKAVRALTVVGTRDAFEALGGHRMRERHVLVRAALREARRVELGAETLPPEGALPRTRTAKEVTR